MAKVPPFHTEFDEHPAENRKVYHDQDDRRSGTGGKRQCKKCVALTNRAKGLQPSPQVLAH